MLTYRTSVLPQPPMRLLVCLALCASLANAANFLVIFPLPTASNGAVFRALADALESRGHTLTIITADPNQITKTPNVVEIDFSFTHKTMERLVNTDPSRDEVEMLAHWTRVVDAFYDEQFSHPTIKEMIKRKENLHYDAIIVEFANLVPWQAFALLFNAPVIGVAPSGEMSHFYHHEHGNVVNPVLHPEPVFPFHAGFSFVERARVLHYYLWYHFYYKRVLNEKFDNIIKRHMGTVSLPTDALHSIAEVLLVNTHPALGHVRPLLSTTVQLGFMHVTEPKAITDTEISDFLSSSSKPTIYISLSSLHLSAVETFKKAFSSLTTEFDVLWKWNEKEEMKEQPTNVFTRSWFPQADLLAHERVTLFITNGGQLSMEEAVDRGVPLIAIPFTADQHSNAQRITNLGIGVSHEASKLTKDTLISAIREVTTGNFTERVRQLSKIIKDEPTTPIDRAIWWTEYVARHGGTLHLDYRGRHVPFWKYLGLDFIAIAIVIWHVLVKLVKFVVRRIFCSKKKIRKSKKE